MPCVLDEHTVLIFLAVFLPSRKVAQGDHRTVEKQFPHPPVVVAFSKVDPGEFPEKREWGDGVVRNGERLVRPADEAGQQEAQNDVEWPDICERRARESDGNEVENSHRDEAGEQAERPPENDHPDGAEEDAFHPVDAEGQLRTELLPWV
ncbi:MAG: hypothetical protein MUF19_02340 [Candidatus Pacebacteria bacterium]|nr:hypothetical protein [Candidatus Paceibacterota bacterium]